MLAYAGAIKKIHLTSSRCLKTAGQVVNSVAADQRQLWFLIAVLTVLQCPTGVYIVCLDILYLYSISENLFFPYILFLSFEQVNFPIC